MRAKRNIRAVTCSTPVLGPRTCRFGRGRLAQGALEQIGRQVAEGSAFQQAALDEIVKDGVRQGSGDAPRCAHGNGVGVHESLKVGALCALSGLRDRCGTTVVGPPTFAGGSRYGDLDIHW